MFINISLWCYDVLIKVSVQCCDVFINVSLWCYDGFFSSSYFPIVVWCYDVFISVSLQYCDVFIDVILCCDAFTDIRLGDSQWAPNFQTTPGILQVHPAPRHGLVWHQPFRRTHHSSHRVSVQCLLGFSTSKAVMSLTYMMHWSFAMLHCCLNFELKLSAWAAHVIVNKFI